MHEDESLLVDVSQRGLGFEVEVLLPADGHLAAETPSRASERAGRVTLRELELIR